MSDPAAANRVAVVLAGGAARGAYEVGVLAYILRNVSRALGRPVPMDIFSGTSVGAINACMLAAFADEPILRADLMEQHWRSLHIQDMVRLDSRELLNIASSAVGRRKAPSPNDIRRGGLLDSSGIENVIRQAVPFRRIRDHLKKGLLHAVTISTTHIATGKTVIFVQRHDAPKIKDADKTVLVRGTELTVEHAMASAAIPMLFPAVRIGGEYFCDGGLRQNVPLSPARRLGATGLVVVNPRFIPTPKEIRASQAPNEEHFPGPFFLLGKALNALLLDRIDNDIDRLLKINQIFEAGTKCFGPTFIPKINEALGNTGTGSQLMQPLKVVHIRVSQDIGKLSGEYVRSAKFSSRTRGVLGKALHTLADWQGSGESDLISYVLFDGGFAAQLIDLGERDAKLRHDELCTFFEHFIRVGGG